MKKKCRIAFILLLIFLCGCSSEVAQTNDSFTANLLMYSTYDWYIDTGVQFKEENAGLNIDIGYFDANAFDLYNDREYKDVNLSELQSYYDEIVNALRNGTAGDLVVGDALYLDWAEITPIDWQKLMKNGTFSVVESDDEVLAYAKINSSKSAFVAEEDWALVPLTTELLGFYTNESLAKKWNFSFPDNIEDPNNDDTILEFLEKCAAWVEEYGDVDGAPSIMPDYEFRRLKGVVFDVCGINIVDYANEIVDFDNETVRRLLQALKTIETDIEESGIGDQHVGVFSKSAAQAQRYLICEGYVFTDDYLSMIPWDVNREYHCCYATRWAAIPASSANKENAVRYLETLVNNEKMYGRSLSWNYFTMPQEFRQSTERSKMVVIPETWQYALSELFNEYYSGRMDIDEFVSQVQSRLEVYITE